MHSVFSIPLSLFFFLPALAQQDSVVVNPAPKALQELFENIAEAKEAASEYEIELEIDGLLVDDTKTKIGRDFYEIFYSNWEAPKEARNYTITIREKPFRLTTTLVEVLINDNIVYQSMLQPRQDILEGLSEQAVAHTYNYLLNYEEIMRQLNGEDQAGTGIF